jgi:hypothetical protein
VKTDPLSIYIGNFISFCAFSFVVPMEETMLKLTLAAIAVSAALGMSAASAMPIDKLGSSANIGTQTQTVRLVCNAWGRCWRRPNYYYGAYGFYPRRHYGWGYRRWHRW